MARSESAGPRPCGCGCGTPSVSAIRLRGIPTGTRKKCPLVDEKPRSRDHLSAVLPYPPSTHPFICHSFVIRRSLGALLFAPLPSPIARVLPLVWALVFELCLCLHPNPAHLRLPLSDTRRPTPAMFPASVAASSPSFLSSPLARLSPGGPRRPTARLGVRCFLLPMARVTGVAELLAWECSYDVQCTAYSGCRTSGCAARLGTRAPRVGTGPTHPARGSLKVQLRRGRTCPLAAGFYFPGTSCRSCR